MNVNERQGLIRLRRPEGPSAYTIISKRVAAGSAPHGAFITSSKYTTLTVAPGECNDGMSDSVYTHTAVYDMGGRNLFYGCCDIDAQELEAE